METGSMNFYWRWPPGYMTLYGHAGCPEAENKNEEPRADDRHGKPGLVTPLLTILPRLSIP